MAVVVGVTVRTRTRVVFCCLFPVVLMEFLVLVVFMFCHFALVMLVQFVMVFCCLPFVFL